MGSNGSRESPQLLQGVPEAVSKPSARSPWVNTALQPALLGKPGSTGVPWGEPLQGSSVGWVGAGGKGLWSVQEKGAARPRSRWGSGAEPWPRRSLLVTHRGDTAVGRPRRPRWARPAIYGSRETRQPVWEQSRAGGERLGSGGCPVSFTRASTLPVAPCACCGRPRGA